MLTRTANRCQGIAAFVAWPSFRDTGFNRSARATRNIANNHPSTEHNDASGETRYARAVGEEYRGAAERGKPDHRVEGMRVWTAALLTSLYKH